MFVTYLPRNRSLNKSEQDPNLQFVKTHQRKEAQSDTVSCATMCLWKLVLTSIAVVTGSRNGFYFCYLCPEIQEMPVFCTCNICLFPVRKGQAVTKIEAIAASIVVTADYKLGKFRFP